MIKNAVLAKKQQSFAQEIIVRHWLQTLHCFKELISSNNFLIAQHT